MLERHEDDPTIWYTKLIALGLGPQGEPMIPNEIAANYSLAEGKVIQTRPVDADGADAAGTSDTGWDGLPRFVPTNEVVDYPGDEDDEPP